MRSLLLLLLLLSAAAQTRAQSTEADLKARLLHKPLYLRSFWHDDTLHFDPTGTLIGSSAPTAFTLCGIDISSVHRKSDRLVLSGQRVGLEFVGTNPLRVAFVKNMGMGIDSPGEGIEIDIAPPASGDYAPALNSIFIEDASQLPALVPPYWKKYVQKTFGTPAATPVAPATDPDATKTWGDVIRPTFKVQVKPNYTPYARLLKYNGDVLISLFIDPEGHPTHPEIVRGLGLGLDEQALIGLLHSSFNPATRDGKPLAVRIQIAVSFEIY